jgi:chromosome segregation ATPase
MEQITLRVTESTKESLESEAKDSNQTLSDYMRDLIDSRTEDTVSADEYDRLREEHEKLQSEHERLRTEVDRVRREKRQILDNRDENRQLVEYVERERENERHRRQANALKRARWWLFGHSTDETQG